MANNLNDLLGLYGLTKKEDDEAQLLEAINPMQPSLESTLAKLSGSPEIYGPPAPVAEVMGPPAPSKILPKLVKEPVVLSPLTTDIKDAPVEVEDALTTAQKNQTWSNLIGGLSDASSRIGSALTGGRGKYVEIGGDAKKIGEQGVADVLTKRKADQDKVTAEQEKQMADPNSDISKSSRAAIKEIYPNLNIGEGTSAKQLNAVGFNLGMAATAKENRALRADTAKASAEDRALKREELKLKEETLRQERDTKKLDKDILDLSKRYEKSGISDAVTTLDAIKKEIEGVEDLPGYDRAGGILPDFLVSNEGVKLRQLMNTLSNIELKKRSGTAVTDPEFKRFKAEFGTGTLMSEEALKEGLLNYENRLNNLIKEYESGSAPTAVKEYKSREGSISPLKQETSSLVKVRLSNGKIVQGSKEKLQDLLKKYSGAKVLE